MWILTKPPEHASSNTSSGTSLSVRLWWQCSNNEIGVGGGQRWRPPPFDLLLWFTLSNLSSQPQGASHLNLTSQTPARGTSDRHICFYITRPTYYQMYLLQTNQFVCSFLISRKNKNQKYVWMQQKWCRTLLFSIGWSISELSYIGRSLTLWDVLWAILTLPISKRSCIRVYIL
jgi:hypothetical protein